MALSGTTNKQSFTATASQTAFVFTIPFFNATRASDSGTTLKFGDIKVTREAAGDGTITALTPADSPSTVNQFKVTATNGDPAQGGTVTIGSGATVSDIYIVERNISVTQEYDLQEGATIDPTALNKALDRVVAQNQQQSDEFSRSITFPVTDADTITYNVDSSSSNRAGKILGFDSSGNVTELAQVSGSASVDTSRGLQLVNNQVGVKDNGITNAFIADDAVDTAQIADNAVRTAQVLDNNITKDKLSTIADMRVLGNTSGGTRAPQEVRIKNVIQDDSDKGTTIATQGSIKTYVDTEVTNAIDASRVYNSHAHSTTSGTIINNNTGRPLFISFTLESSNDITQLELDISANSDMSSSTTIFRFSVIGEGTTTTEGTATGIVPAGYYWRVTHESTSESNMVHSSFKL